MMSSKNAEGTAQPDKPIMYMTPSELFADPQLRQLAVAAQHGNIKKIDALIAKGVDVNGHGKYGIGPLFSATQTGNKAGFTALLDHGANPNNVWTDGYTLMNSIACCSHDPYFMEQALKYGGDPNLVEPHTGKTPILAAITVSGKVNIPPLIKARANLNYQAPIWKGGSPKYPPSGGETAMIEAVADQQFDVIYELLEAGADYRLRDGRGWNLEDHIKFAFRLNVSLEQNRWSENVVEFLKRHNAWSGATSGNRTHPSEAVASTTASRVTNYEAPGNLAATRAINCIVAGKLSNKDTPADLYPAVMQCLNEAKYERAVFIYALAGVYARFDAMRVADETAHDAATVFLSRMTKGVPRAKLKQFDEVKEKTLGDQGKLAEICTRIRQIGPPEYYPRYMVQHGMQAFTGFKTPKGLVPDFDAGKAWTGSLRSYLHCPDAHGKAQ
jgi:hypothetical protein